MKTLIELLLSIVYWIIGAVVTIFVWSVLIMLAIKLLNGMFWLYDEMPKLGLIVTVLLIVAWQKFKP